MTIRKGKTLTLLCLEYEDDYVRIVYDSVSDCELSPISENSQSITMFLMFLSAFLEAFAFLIVTYQVRIL